jgi:hypothetical protein
MIQSSRLRSLFLSALFALPFVAGPVLPGSLRAAEEKKIEFPAASQRSVVKQRVGLTDVEVDYRVQIRTAARSSAAWYLMVSSGARAQTPSPKLNSATR